ncbi:MAG: hypothetical protein ACKV2T_25000 [Kofleriaceae bacterium]
MRLVAYSLLVLAACNSSEGEDWPVEPGGGGGSFGNTIGSGSATDAGMDDGGTTNTGRVCALSEILRWDECDNGGQMGLTVTVGAESAMTLGDGSFEIDTPTGSNLVWRVSGNAQLPSLREYAAGTQIPSISIGLFQNIAAAANVAIEIGAGTVFVQVRHMNAAVVGATAELAGSNDLVYYDDATAPGSLSVGQTRADGIVWFPNVTPGAAVQFTITPPTAVGEPQVTTVVVEEETATFATVVFP